MLHYIAVHISMSQNSTYDYNYNSLFHSIQYSWSNFGYNYYFLAEVPI